MTRAIGTLSRIGLALALVLAPGLRTTRALCPEGAPDVAVSVQRIYPLSSEPEAPSMFHAAQIAVGSSGRIFVYDAGNGRILRLAPDGRHQLSFGNGGSADERLEVSSAAGALLALDRLENVYATVPASRIVRVFGPDGKFVRSVALPFTLISGLAVADDGSILVSPLSERLSSTVYRFSPEGRFLSSFGDRLVAVKGPTATQLNVGVLAVARDGSIFQAFCGWPVVRKYRADGSLLWESHFDLPAALRKIIPAELTLDYVRSHPAEDISVNAVSFAVVPTRDGGCRLMTNGFGLVRVEPTGEVASVRTLAVDAAWDRRFFGSFALSGDERELLLLDTIGGRVFSVSRPLTDRLFGAR